MAEYNKARPHQAIGMLTPAERFALRGEASEVVLDEPPADPLATVTRKVASNGIISVSGQVFSVGAALAGKLVTVQSTTTCSTSGAPAPESVLSCEPAEGRSARRTPAATNGRSMCKASTGAV